MVKNAQHSNHIVLKGICQRSHVRQLQLSTSNRTTLIYVQNRPTNSLTMVIVYGECNGLVYRPCFNIKLFWINLKFRYTHTYPNNISMHQNTFHAICNIFFFAFFISIIGTNNRFQQQHLFSSSRLTTNNSIAIYFESLHFLYNFS